MSMRKSRDTNFYLGSRRCRVIGHENSREVWVEFENGDVLRVYRGGLSTSASPRRLELSALRVEDDRTRQPAT